ncbi:MAG: hypothetical protein HQ581_16595, partial [Planctomycetes bacterium]|nr:hypothetical protein [Planctomycetota bacterium]
VVLGTATQSSTGSGGVPTRGNDGNTDGNWGGGSVQHTGSGVGQWWQVELPSVTDLDAVHVWSRTDCCWDRVDDFNLIVSDAVGDQIYNQRITGVGSGAGRNRLISLSAIDAVVMTTPITVVSDSGLSAVSDSTATFTDVTLNNGTALATSGADTIFSGLTLAGASGTLAPTNHLAVTGYNDGGAAKTLIMGGTGTLLIDNAASGISAAATTFEAASGRLEANGPNALGGSTSLTISGGTAAFGDHVGPPTIASGALGAWTFDSGTAADTSGSFNNGIAGGSLTYEADTPLGVGQSLQSHSGGGAGNVLTVPNSASLQSIDDSLSLAYWMKSNTGDNGNWVRLFQKGTEANGDRSWMVNRYNNGNEVNVRVDTTGGFNQNIARGGPQPFDGEWHHVTFTFDSGTWNKYFDGEQVGTGGYNHGDGLTNTRDLYIFGRNAAGHYVGSLDDIYLYDRALSSTEVRDLVHTLTAPDMSAVNVSVTAPSSTLEVNSIAPATFNSLTMANGTDLTTTGNVAGITFKQTTLPGGTATFKPEVPTTLTGTTGLANPGSASRLVAAGSSDLIINKAPTGSMANVTHEAKSGRMVLDYVGGDPTGGAPLVATGGTFTMQGAPGLLSNQLEYAFYDNASNTTLAAIDDGTDGNGQNGGLFALTPSNQSAWPSQVRGKSSWTDEVWQGGNISNSYAQMWSGKVTVPADGTYQVRVHGDDHEMFWLDVNQDGEFNTGTDDITRNVPPEGWNAAKTGSVTLAAGQTYDFAIAHYEGGGGDFVQVEITPPAALGMPTFRINPSDPDQNGLWSRSGITALDIQNTLTVDNVPADGFGMSGFMIGGRNDSNLDFAGGGGLLSETPVGSTLFDGLLDINGDGAFRALIPEITRNDDYQSLFTGTLTVDPASAGNHRFEMANKDDRTVIWVDLDQDGAFSHTGTAGDEQMFGLNNGNRTVNLAAGEYAVAMGHMEHGGGSRIRALIQTPAFGNRVIDPSDPAQAGLWSTTPTSTLELITDVDANLRELVLKNGDLRITGGNHLSVEQASISPTSSANVGLITDTDTLLTGNTGFTGNGRTATFTKAGDATLTLDKPGTGLGDVTWKVTQGTLAVSGDNPLGPDGSNVNLAGGIFQVTGAVTAGAVTRDPTAHWAFDETTGTTAADSTGTYNGSLQGDPVWQPAGGVAGGALLLDGNGDHVLIPGGANRIDIDNKSYSLAFWANRDSTDGDYVIGQGDNGNTRSSLHVGFRDNNTFTNAVWGDDLNFDSATVTDTADWHHWVATYDADGNRQEIWMDGQLVAGRGTGGDFQSNGSNDFWIGRRRDGNNFAGLLDEVYVFDGVLGSDEVQSLFANSHIGAIDMTDTNFRVTADSTLNAETALTAAFGNVTFEAGTLNVVGAPGGVSFTGGGIAAGAIASGINNSADVTINGPFDGNNATATFTKTGAGALILPQGTVNHGGVSVNANGGRIVSGGAMQAANLTIGGGGNVDTGVNDVTIGDGGAFSAGSMKISGSGSPFTVGGDNMAAGPQRLGLTGGTVTINGGGMPGGVQLWVDASDIDADGNPGNNPADGANITVWKDKTGLGGRDFDGRASDPSYRTSGPDLPNGNPVVYFDGNDELWTTFDLDFVSEYSIFSVARYAGSGNSDGQSRRVIDSRDHNWLFGYHGALDERFYAEGWIHTTGSDNTDWHLHTGTMNDDPDPKASFWKEGNLLTSNDTGSNNTNYKPGQLRFGGRGSENSNSEVAELLVFDHLLTADELNSVGGYLAAKYGINAPNYTGNIDPPPIDLPDTDVNVSANSTLHADTALTATFGNLDMAAGVDLTLTGADAGFSFNNVSGGHSVDRGMTVRGGIAPGVGVESDFGVGGNLVFDDTAGANTYDWDLGPDADDDGIGQYDTVRVSGDLTLGDWTLALHDLGGEAAEWDPLALFTGFS